MSEHTPGPLTINGPSPGGSDMDDGGDYAIVTGDQIIGEAIRKTAPSTFQPAEANARLWAASPDLLAALEWAEWTMKGYAGNYCIFCMNLQKHGHEPNCQLALALAKAKEVPA